MGSWFDFLWALGESCRTERALRELVILRIAFFHQSAYEWHRRLAMANPAGLSPEAIRAVTLTETAPELSGDELLALQMTDAICAGTVSDDLARQAVDHCGYEAYVELVVTGPCLRGGPIADRRDVGTRYHGPVPTWWSHASSRALECLSRRPLFCSPGQLARATTDLARPTAQLTSSTKALAPITTPKSRSVGCSAR
ncbi:MAG: carboxymuconolactone decarboxylase family protein [Acidimicrobiales bacterium]